MDKVPMVIGRSQGRQLVPEVGEGTISSEDSDNSLVVFPKGFCELFQVHLRCGAANRRQARGERLKGTGDLVGQPKIFRSYCLQLEKENTRGGGQMCEGKISEF